MDNKDELTEMRQKLEAMEKALFEAQTAAAAANYAPPPEYPPPPVGAMPPQYPPQYIPPKYQYQPPPLQVAIPPQVEIPPQRAIPPKYQYPAPGYVPYPAYQKPKTKWSEAVIGKYLVGIIAALLIFAAAVSLVILLWDNIMTELAIFIIVLSAGLGILAVGFVRLHKYKDAITSILIGTGTGLVYIALAAGHIAFSIVDELTALCLILVWSAGLLLSFKFSKLFFTSIIAYAGGFIALLFFYTRVTETVDLIAALIFMFIVLGVFLVSTSLWMDKLKQYIAGVLSLALPISFIIAFADNQLHRNHNFALFLCMIVCSIIIYWLYFYIRHSIRDNLTGVKGIALEATALIAAYSLFATFLPVWGPALPGLPELVRVFIVTGIIGAALVFMYKHSIAALLTFMYAVIITVSKFNSIEISFPILGVLTLASFFLKDARFNSKKIVTLCLTYISFLGIVICRPYNAFDQSLLSNLVYITGALSTVAVSLCLVWNSYKKEEHIGLIINAKISAFTIAAVLISTLSTLIVSYRYDGRPYSLGDTVFLAVMALICFAAYYSGYFLDWRGDGAFPYRNKEIKRYSFDVSGLLAFSFIFLLYAVCLFVLIWPGINPWYLKLINTLTTLCVLLLQTYVLVGRFNKIPFTSVATGMLCLLFGWVFLYSWFGAGLHTLEASIVGLAIAFGSIFTGVMLRISAYRVFGLVLTLCMTAKAILLDIIYTDGVTRVIALLIGGIICFGISIVYSMLETRLKQAQTPDEDEVTITLQDSDITEGIETVVFNVPSESNDSTESNDSVEI